MEILVVEDDKTIAAGLEYSLQQEGYDVCICDTVKAGKEIIEKRPIGLCIFDVMLPDGSGYELCKPAKDKDLPVLFLTACDEEVNVVMGLDMGADDYITKPFRLRELVSRIHSVLRRYQRDPGNQTQQKIVFLGNIKVLLTEAKVYKGSEEIILTALEYRLLLTFINHKKQVLSRNQLLQSIWDVAEDFVNDNTLTVYIKRLREKLEDDPQHPQLIHTVRGLGYRLEEKE